MKESIQDSREPLTPEAQRFKDAIDAKFTEVEANEGAIDKGGLAREHEQTIMLDTAAFPHISPNSRVFATRPIPEEAAEAAEKWSEFGGHSIMIFNPEYRSQRDFLIVDGKLADRGLVGGDSTMGSRGIPMEDPVRETELVDSIEQARAYNIPPVEAVA